MSTPCLTQIISLDGFSKRTVRPIVYLLLMSCQMKKLVHFEFIMRVQLWLEPGVVELWNLLDVLTQMRTELTKEDVVWLTIHSLLCNWLWCNCNHVWSIVVHDGVWRIRDESLLIAVSVTATVSLTFWSSIFHQMLGVVARGAGHPGKKTNKKNFCHLQYSTV